MGKKDLANFDVVIAGGGPAGLSAALWCDELGLSAVLIEGGAEFGGQLLRTFNEIGNHLGGGAPDGRALRDAFLSQLSGRAFTRVTGASVAAVDFGARVATTSDGRAFGYRALIVATGVRRRRLGVAREDEFAGRGIIESGKKEAANVAGKRVVIVGGGDAALENALILGETAASVAVVHRRDAFRARPEFVEPALAHPRVRVFLNHEISELRGGDRLEGVVSVDRATGEPVFHVADVLLPRIGVEPNSDIFVGSARLDEAGYVIVDRDCKTSLESVFAAGDVANPTGPTVSSAVGMGATAAKAVFASLNG